MNDEISNTVQAMFGEPKIVSMLKEDHRQVKALFSAFENAESVEQTKLLVDEIITELTIHSMIEEDLVYPEIIDEVEESTIEAYEEHRLVKVLLSELYDMDGSELNFRAKVIVLKEMIEHHVKEEEKELLPKLKKLDIDLDDLAAKAKKRKLRLIALAETRKKVVNINKRRAG